MLNLKSQTHHIREKKYRRNDINFKFSLVASCLAIFSSSVIADVYWEDYRGISGVPTTSDESIISKPSFENLNNQDPINKLANLLSANPNGSGAINSGYSPNIDWRSDDFKLCTSNITNPDSFPACNIQAMGRVSYATIKFPEVGVYNLSVAHDDNVEYQLSGDLISSDFRSVVYDIPVGEFPAWTNNDEDFRSFGDFTASEANSCARLRVYWTNQGGVNHNRFQWTRPDGVTEIVPESAYLLPDGSESSECSSSIYVASLDLIKTGQLSQDENSISYSFSVTNTGNSVLSNVTVADPLLPNLTCSTIPSLGIGITTPVSCSGGNIYQVLPEDYDAGQVVNTATATALDPNNFSIKDDSVETIPLTQQPELSVVKSVTSSGPYELNSTIDYQFVVTNTGNVTLSGVAVNDALPGISAVSCPATTLAIGQDMTCTATYQVQQADVNAGNVHNSATASGTPPGTSTTPNPDPVTSPPSTKDTPIASKVNPVPVPLDSPWMLVLLSAILLFFGFCAYRKRV